jgi:outer membrane protein TolC
MKRCSALVVGLVAVIALIAVIALLAGRAAAQEPARSVHLDALQDAAMRTDPRARQTALLRAQSALREANLDAERRPTLSVEGQAQYQSDVAQIPFTLPGGTQPAPPPHDTYDARLVARQRLIDPSLGPRREVERAQLAESEARVATTLFPLRTAVDDAYFAALLLQAQRSEIATLITDLEAQHELAADRVRAGSALPSEAAILHAELLRRRQALSELDANRGVALDLLRDLTGVRIGPADTLVLPVAAVEQTARMAMDTLRARPEYRQFERSREVLARQAAVAAARDKPRLVAFGRAGYGRPGLNPLAAEFDSYWLAGLQVEWSPWSWGTTRRDREVLAIQREVVATEEAAFTAALERGVLQDFATIARLQATLASDEQIIALREQVLRETRVRYRESVITSAEYVDRQTDLANARIDRARHTIELAQARAHLRTRLGLEE